MKAKTSLTSQIGAVDHAFQHADRLDASRAKSDLLKRQLEDAAKTLRFVQKHEGMIKAAIEKARGQERASV